MENNFSHTKKADKCIVGPKLFSMNPKPMLTFFYQVYNRILPISGDIP